MVSPRRRFLLRSVVSLSVLVTLSLPTSRARDLTFEERVRAEEAIQQVYYSHQIGKTKPFEEAVPHAVLEKKVRTYLQQTIALQRYWSTPVTAEMLEAELERMQRQTRMPERLRELFAALGDDSFLVEECFVRPALVDRLSRNFFAYDERIHGAAREEATELRQRLAMGRLDPRADNPRRTVWHVSRVRREGARNSRPVLVLDLMTCAWSWLRMNSPRGGKGFVGLEK